MKKDKKKEPSRIERKKTEMKNKIIDTTIGLIELNGYDLTTMEQIAKETDIAKGTLYNYFSEKEAIVSEYIKRTFNNKNSLRIKTFEELPNTETRMVYIINNLLDGIKLKKEIFEKYLVYTMKNVVSFEKDKSQESGISGLILAIIELGKKEGDIRCDLKVEMIVDFFVFIVIMVSKEFYINEEEFNQSHVVEKGVDLFMNGVKPNA